MSFFTWVSSFFSPTSIIRLLDEDGRQVCTDIAVPDTAWTRVVNMEKRSIGVLGDAMFYGPKKPKKLQIRNEWTVGVGPLEIATEPEPGDIIRLQGIVVTLGKEGT